MDLQGLLPLPSEVQGLAKALADRYVIEREIGHGGMATIYLARDLRHDRKVALKVLDPELAAVLGVERFLSEIRVTANLQHPNLLPLFDSGDADRRLFYVMPDLSGVSRRRGTTTLVHVGQQFVLPMGPSHMECRCFDDERISR